MKQKSVIVLIALVFCFSSCIEVLDDIQINTDGTGTLKYNVNLSASKVKINSILALDSLEGKKVPSLEEIKAQIEKFKTALSQQDGIEGVEIEADFENYLFKLKCDFTSVDLLQKAVKTVVEKEYRTENSNLNFDLNWLTWNAEKLERSIPDFQIKKAQELKPEEIELLKSGSYISITRFDRNIKNYSNAKAMLSKNKMAVMLRENAYAVTQNPKLLENTIYLSPEKP
ncbi:MAG: hypothetical protein KJ941_10075 [Bacteroidetes bacterium]|nr:hypothetical protein [Bacteroidota bacterium]